MRELQPAGHITNGIDLTVRRPQRLVDLYPGTSRLVYWSERCRFPRPLRLILTRSHPMKKGRLGSNWRRLQKTAICIRPRYSRGKVTCVFSWIYLWRCNPLNLLKKPLVFGGFTFTFPCTSRSLATCKLHKMKSLIAYEHARRTPR